MYDNLTRTNLEFAHRETEKRIAELEQEKNKVKYTLKKIIETVHNDRIDEYGARLVLIKDFASECLEELEK